MTDLHVKWMDEPGPTDVLSFPMDELRPGPRGRHDARRPARRRRAVPRGRGRSRPRTAGHSTAEELLLLTTHGILHLLGYDHAEPEEEKEMFALQRRLLLTFLASPMTDIPVALLVVVAVLGIAAAAALSAGEVAVVRISRAAVTELRGRARTRRPTACARSPSTPPASPRRRRSCGCSPR